jgi:flagellar basal body rod protein FlgG
MLRSSLFAVCLALVSSVVADSPRVLRETRDDRHVAVIGDGFLRAEDADGKTYFLRSCLLAEDADGTLCASLDGKLLKFVPPVSVPNDATQILLDPSGEVSVLLRGDRTRIQIGLLESSFVRRRAGMREVGRGVLVCDERVVPVTDAFGEQSRTFLIQGWIDDPAIDQTK